MRIRLVPGPIVALWALALFGSQPMLWAQSTPIVVRQGDFQATVFPLLGAASAEEFYNYSLFDYQARTSLEIPRHSLIAFYRDSRTGKLALIIIHNAPDAGSGGGVKLRLEGLPSTAQLTLKDDPSDEYTFEPPNAQVTWRWVSGRTDGLVVNDLGERFTLTLTPQLMQGVVGWKVYTVKDPAIGPERIPLPSLTDPIEIFVGEGPPPPPPATAPPGPPVRQLRPEENLIQREISTPQAQPGSAFRVALALRIGVTSHGLGVEEQLPTGWRIEPVQNDGAIFKFTNARGQWLFPTILKSGDTKRIVYDVRVPEAEELIGAAARFTIQGKMTSASPVYTVPITGESEIEIVSCLSEAVAIAHLDLRSGQVDLRGHETISPEQMAQAVAFWQASLPVPGTCAALMSSEALQRVMMHQLLNIRVDEPLPPPWTDPAAPPVTVKRTLQTPLPAGQLYPKAPRGEAFRVELLIQAQQDLPGLRIIEQLPADWRVQPLVLLSAVFREGEGGVREWIFPELISAGGVRRLVYEVTVPTDAAPATVMLKGASESGQMAFTQVTQGDSAVKIIECLSLLLAVAHLDAKTGQIDLSLDNTISREQSEAAFLLWLDDREVPGTCGRKLDLATLQRIVTHALTGQPVEP